MRVQPTIAAVFILTACSREAPPTLVPAPAPAAFTAQPTVPAKSPERAQVRIAEDIRRACGIADSDAHFDFDSSRLQPGDQPTLAKVVVCFASGPLRGRNLLLVGHADPRGDSDYNLVLGGSRADNVLKFLVEDGLPRTAVAQLPEA